MAFVLQILANALSIHWYGFSLADLLSDYIEPIIAWVPSGIVLLAVAIGLVFSWWPRDLTRNDEAPEPRAMSLARATSRQSARSESFRGRFWRDDFCLTDHERARYQKIVSATPPT